MDGFNPDAYLAEAAAAPPPSAGASTPLASTPAPSATPPVDQGFNPDDYLKDQASEQYGGIGQQAIAGIEGLAQGVAGPLATLAETKLLGVDPEGIAGRAEANPWTHGISEGAGLVGSAFIPGLGEYTLGAKVAQAGHAAAAAGKALEIGKVGQAALKLGIEGGLFHLSDNTSKMILGQTDPEAPVSSLLAGLPTAIVLGGVGGAALGKASSKLQEIVSSKASSKAAQWAADLGNQFEFLSKNKDLVGAASEEAQHLHDTVAGAVEGGFGLKRASIEKLTQGIDPANTAAYVNGLRSTLTQVPRALAESGQYQELLEKWEQDVMGKTDIIGAPTHTPGPADIFEATDNFKRGLQGIAKFEKRATSAAVEAEAKAAAQVSHHIRTSLENPGAWGEMGRFQSELNKAYSDLQAPLKDFVSSAMSKKEGMPEIDPQKISNIFRSVSKGKAGGVGFKADKVADFFDPARKFLETVDRLHVEQGLESNIPKVSTTVLDKMLSSDVAPGAKAADWIFGAGPGAVGWAGSHAVGTAVGATVGHPYLGFRAGEHLYPILKEMGRRPTKAVVAGILRALSAGEASSIHEAASYAQGIANGAARIDQSVENIFKVGGKQYLNSDFNEKDHERLDKFVEEGALNQQIENEKNAGPAPASNPQAFAHGGEVLAPEPAQPATKPVGKALSGAEKVSAVYPEQAMMLGAAKGRINNYLNSIRPQKIQAKLPFDGETKDKAKDRSYKRALNIANKPLSVLDNIKNGTLEPEHVQHMNALYPEMTQHLQKKLTEQITKAQMANERPPYKVRQALSLFMGAPMDSSFTPASIQAAQAVFVNQKQNQMPQGGSGDTKKLKDSPNQYRTADQSRQVRQNRPK